MAHGKGGYMAHTKRADADCHMIASIGGPLSTQVHILGVEIRKLLDTGSCGNFIKSSLVDQFNLHPAVCKLPQPFQIRVANGMMLLVKTSVTVPICMGEDGKDMTEFLTTCLVADIAPDLVLGLTFLRTQVYH